MPYVRTDDRVRLYYEEHGPTDPDATGSPLVLAYGIGGNADLWDVNIPALAARHRLVLWEPRGHARSDSPEDPARYFVRALGAGSQGRARRPAPAHRARRRALARRRHRHPLHARVPHARARAARDELVVGRRPTAVVRQPRDARAIDQGHPRARHGRDGRVRDGLEPERRRAAGAGSLLQGRVLRVLPAPHADRLCERAARVARDGSHHRPARGPPCARAADRRRPRSVARSDEGDAREDPPLATGRALTGQPLRQSRPARGVEPRGAGVPGTLRRRRARTTPRAPALRSGEAEQDVTRRRRWSCRSSRYRTSWWSRGPRDGLA